MTADGTPDMAAPAPNTADGKVDLSGVWETYFGPPVRQPQAAAGSGQAPSRPTVSNNVFSNLGAQNGEPPYQSWAAALVKQRMADNSKDNPDAHCLPLGIAQNTTHPYPKKIIQTPREVVMIYEGSGTTVREIFLDGRPLPPEDAQPTYNGYSVGRWEGDTLVVETARFLDDGWLDVRGSPLTSSGRMTERFRRPAFGTLEIEMTIDDPKAYTRPFTATIRNRLLVDQELIEFVCIEKSAPHYVGADGIAGGQRATGNAQPR